MRVWTNFSAVLVVIFAFMAMVLEVGSPDEELLLPDVFIFAAFLLAVVARMPLLKEKIPQRWSALASWVVAAFPLVFMAIMLWQGVTRPYEDAAERTWIWTVIALFVIFAFLPFVVYVVLQRLFHLLKGLIMEPPQSLMGWCSRVSGWALLAVVLVGGSPFVMAWAEHNRVWVIPTYCLGKFAEKGVFGTRGPGLEPYLNALTEGTTGERKGAGKHAATMARLDFLAVHTQHGICAPLDEERYAHWVQKMSAERDWSEAHYLLAFKYGYGGFVNGELGKVGINSHSEFADERFIPAWANDAYIITAVPDRWGSGEELDLETSFAMLERAAEGGYDDAQWFLAHAYASGVWGKDGALAVGVDYEKSTQWLEEFAAQQVGSEFVFYMLGERYYRAEEYGLQRDDAKVYEYMGKAAGSERRHVYSLDAMLELALMHQEGIGVAPSAAEAQAWLGKAEQELALINEEGRKALEALREEENIALVQTALEQKQRKFEETRAVIGTYAN